jgi:hypothetical protein
MEYGSEAELAFSLWWLRLDIIADSRGYGTRSKKVSNQDHFASSIYFVLATASVQACPWLWQALQEAALSCKVKRETFYVAKEKTHKFT